MYQNSGDVNSQWDHFVGRRWFYDTLPTISNGDTIGKSCDFWNRCHAQNLQTLIGHLHPSIHPNTSNASDHVKTVICAGLRRTLPLRGTSAAMPFGFPLNGASLSPDKERSTGSPLLATIRSSAASKSEAPLNLSSMLAGSPGRLLSVSRLWS